MGVGPSITFSNPGKIDLPLVDLDVSTTDVTVGEEVIFTMDAEVISNRTDFESQRFFKIDFDGDGVFESDPIKDNEFIHVYDQVGEYSPQVRVKYRDKVNFDSQRLCVNVPDCAPGSEFSYERTGSDEEIILVEYPAPGEYTLSLA